MQYQSGISDLGKSFILTISKYLCYNDNYYNCDGYFDIREGVMRNGGGGHPPGRNGRTWWRARKKLVPCHVQKL